MLESMPLRARLALLSVAVVVTAQCADDPTAADGGPTPSFALAELAPIAAVEGTPVSFFCGTSSDAEGDPLTCEWDFGADGVTDADCTTIDGTCRSDMNRDGVWETTAGSFAYTWPDQANIPVVLHVTDEGGDHSSVATTVTVADVAPNITGRTPLILAVGDTQRMNTRFTDPGADGPWTFHFDFGDGSPVIGPRPISPNIGFGQFHAYSAPGTYTVTVTITDKDGIQSVYTRLATVLASNAAPVAHAGGPYTVGEGAFFTLSSAGTTDDQTSLTYVWEFGDGTRAFVANPSKRYNDNGTFDVRLIVTDPAGAADTALSSVTVTNVAPTATPRIPMGREGNMVTISMSAYEPGLTDRPLLQYQFDCGQGAGPTIWRTTNSYLCPAVPDQGAYPITMSVRDKDGGQSTYNGTMTISNLPPTATLTPLGPTTVPLGSTVQFEGRFNDAGANDGPFTYRFSWGDGSSATGTTPGVMTTTPVVESRTFTRAGTWTIYLFVTDKDGSTVRSNVATITVTP